ncbi:MAG: acetyl-CoA carboxylase biotin carboxyl carrier protein [Magnetococcales bacterium]|nr:acetyl-CoA carboxylase biotin carboxyl carrier protein [Magnetococcales bacterium]
MDLKEIRQLIKMLSGSDVVEIEVRHGEQTVRINRAIAAPAGSGRTVTGSVVTAAALPTSAPMDGSVHHSPTQLEPVVAVREFPHAVPILSPMVGTFYHATGPDAAPFVKLGDVIKKGQSVCIIEAMKLMNEIETEVDGRIVKILKEDATPVEFGEELFLVEPN